MNDDDDVLAIAARIATGDDRGAFVAVRARLAWPRGRELQTSELPRWLGLLGELAARRDAEELAQLATAVVHDPDSPDRLYDLGYALIDAGLPAIGATVLWRCLALVGDSEEVVCELVSALESALAYRDAFVLLEARAPLRARSFLCRYLHAFNAAMTAQLEITRAELLTLEPSSPDTLAMRDAIATIVERADRVAGVCPLDDRDLRGWHYVLNGGLLGHQSPYGFDDPMHGRYAWLQDSLPRIASGLDHLAALIRGLAIPCIYAPPGRDHAIVAHAAASRLGLPIAEWPAVGLPAPGLVVVYDLAQLDADHFARLVQRRGDQIVYAHASPWTHDAAVTPDVTTLLCQSLVAPWAERSVIDPATGQTRVTAADSRDVEAIAADLAASPPLDADELAADQAERLAALVARVWPPAPGTRSRLRAGGPVPSNRFD